MAATDQQVQQFVNERVRPRCEQMRLLEILMSADIAQIDDVYNALLPENAPTWTDNRSDAPPHLLSPADVLAVNAALHTIRDAIVNMPEYAIVQKACVRPPL